MNKNKNVVEAVFSSARIDGCCMGSLADHVPPCEGQDEIAGRCPASGKLSDV